MQEAKKEKKRETSLNEDSINFGKYKDLTLKELLKDRKYCAWLLNQEWFNKQYEYLYNKVKEYKPELRFIKEEKGVVFLDVKDINTTCLNSRLSTQEFLDRYLYFNLRKPKELKDTIVLSETDMKCYKWYYRIIKELKEQIEGRIFVEGSDYTENPYDIKAPTSWLQKFEKKYELSKSLFKEFIASYGLRNIPYIVEDIKKMGGIVYKGAKTFIIAKENSLNQEKFWEAVLKEKYGELISSQYKFKNCIFDFINVKKGVLYEAKLSLKNYNEQQHNKYLCVIGVFKLVYLIDKDCVIDMEEKVLYTTDESKYKGKTERVKKEKMNKLEEMIENFKITKVENICEIV